MDRSSHVPITSRPDIVHVNKLLWLAINEIDRENISLWLNGSFGTLKTPLTWVSGIRRTPFELTAFSDSDHAACLAFPVPSPSDVRYHFIKEQVEKGIVELFFVGTEYQLADLFTKALPEDRFKYLVRRLGMRCLTPEELEVLANESA
ncbi:hypothetical protein Tco_1243947 [Tanacetum coccineum]